LYFAFSTTIIKRTYLELQESLMREREMLILNFENLPNLYVNVHLSQHACNFRTLVNRAVGAKEMVHYTFKGMVSHTNRKVIELDLTRRYNTIQALRHIIDSLTDPRFDTNTNTFKNPHTFMSKQEFKDENDGLSKRLDDKHLLFQNLSKSYLEHFESKVALLNRKVDFYNFIAYTILGDKQGLIQLKVHVGNIVELSEESE
ncbi:17691_t:CDS:2, partial [Funneliformis geosporum]